MGCASIGQLLHYIVIQIRPASEEDIEEGDGGREYTDSNSNVYEDEMPTPDNYTCEEDAERDFEDHHCQNVAGFASHGPL
jgi:hypothetical protein